MNIDTKEGRLSCYKQLISTKHECNKFTCNYTVTINRKKIHCACVHYFEDNTEPVKKWVYMNRDKPMYFNRCGELTKYVYNKLY